MIENHIARHVSALIKCVRDLDPAKPDNTRANALGRDNKDWITLMNPSNKPLRGKDEYCH